MSNRHVTKLLSFQFDTNLKLCHTVHITQGALSKPKGQVMTTLTDWTFEVTRRYNRPSVEITNVRRNYRTYATLWSDGGIGYEDADISPLTPEIQAHLRELLLGDKQ